MAPYPDPPTPQVLSCQSPTVGLGEGKMKRLKELCSKEYQSSKLKSTRYVPNDLLALDNTTHLIFIRTRGNGYYYQAFYR